MPVAPTEAAVAVALAQLDDGTVTRVVKAILQDRPEIVEDVLGDWVPELVEAPRQKAVEAEDEGDPAEEAPKKPAKAKPSRQATTPRASPAPLTAPPAAPPRSNPKPPTAKARASPKAPTTPPRKSPAPPKLPPPMAANVRYTGSLRTFKETEKGSYGFIHCPEIEDRLGKSDVFLHVSQIEMFDDVQIGQVFTFSIGEDRHGGPMAVDLEPVGGTAHFSGQKAAPRQEEEERFVAAVKFYIADKGYGFLESEELTPVLGKTDVFVHAREVERLDRFEPGQLFSFSLVEDNKGNNKGQLVAVNLEPYSEAPPAPEQRRSSNRRPSSEPQRYMGSVKHYNSKKQYGFLECPDLEDMLGKADVFVLASSIPNLDDFQAGHVYSFCLRESDGRPMAVDLELEGSPSGGNGAGARRGHDNRYMGSVKWYNAEKEFGFLVCPELEQQLGKSDVFVHKTQILNLDEFQHGRTFLFTLGEGDHGRPMAVDLEPAADDHKPARRAPRQNEQIDQAALDDVVGLRFEAVAKNWHAERAFGFLNVDGDLAEILGRSDLFVHVSQTDGSDKLIAGRTYSFTLGVSRDGQPEARDLQLVGEEEEEPADEGNARKRPRVGQ
eukprot:TRINITY_DN80824_c0_g1_i1.p1 TRINITY_DN80824_c0_g1~~TRINITY_DN80824_c0_g1_i1.p1  ORF type:complete len:608 (+),score=113.12 TRINITY_DN80824_c0_g1_i1:98-1921(+)